MTISKYNLLSILEEHKNNFFQSAKVALTDPVGKNLKKYRVSVRKLIAFNHFILLISGGGYYKVIEKELKKIIKDFNPIRDNQVLLKIVNLSISKNKKLENLKSYLEHSDNSLLDSNIYFKISKQFQVISTLLIWQKFYITTNFPDNEVIENNIDNTYKQLENNLNIGFHNVNRTDGKSIHKLRIAIKKFRYIDQIAEKFYNKKSKYSNIEELQEIMGQIQDINVLQKSIMDYMDSNQKISDNSVENYYEEIEQQKEEKIEEMMIQIRKNLNIG